VNKLSSAYKRPVLLTAEHDVERFKCRSEEQTKWLTKHALQSQSGSTTRVFVITTTNANSVVAYYAWCMANVGPDQGTERLHSGGGRYPQPVALLARLGVHIDHERRGLGYGLLQDVFIRLVSLSQDIGCRGLLVHAETQEARDFYLHLVPEFDSSPTDKLHLLLLMKDIRRTLGAR